MNDAEYILERVPVSERRDFSLAQVIRKIEGSSGPEVEPGGWGNWGKLRTADCYRELKKTEYFVNEVSPRLEKAMERSGPLDANRTYAPELGGIDCTDGVEVSWNKVAEIIDKQGRKNVKPALLPRFGPAVDHSEMLEYLLLCDRKKVFSNVQNYLYWEGGETGENRADPYVPKFVPGNVYYHPSRQAHNFGPVDTIAGRPATIVGCDLRVFGTGEIPPKFDLVFIKDQSPAAIASVLSSAELIDEYTGIYALQYRPGRVNVWTRMNRFGVLVPRMVAPCGGRGAQNSDVSILPNAANVNANISEMLSDAALEVGWHALSQCKFVVLGHQDQLKAQQGIGLGIVTAPPYKIERSHDDLSSKGFEPPAFPSPVGYPPMAYTLERPSLDVGQKEDVDDGSLLPVSLGTCSDSPIESTIELNTVVGDRHWHSSRGVLPDYAHHSYVSADGLTCAVLCEPKRYPRPQRWSHHDLGAANNTHGAIIRSLKEAYQLSSVHKCTLQPGSCENVTIEDCLYGKCYRAASDNRHGVDGPQYDGMEYILPRDTYTDVKRNVLRCPAEPVLVPVRIRARVDWPRIVVVHADSSDVWAAVRISNYFQAKFSNLSRAHYSRNVDKRRIIESKLSKFIYPDHSFIWNIFRYKSRGGADSAPTDGWVESYTRPRKHGYYHDSEEDRSHQIVYEVIALVIPCI